MRRKQYVSAEYALRRAAYLKEPVAIVQRPLKRALNYVAVTMFPPRGIPKDAKGARLLHSMWRPFKAAARAGQGAALTHFARQHTL